MPSFLSISSISLTTCCFLTFVLLKTRCNSFIKFFYSSPLTFRSLHTDLSPTEGRSLSSRELTSLSTRLSSSTTLVSSASYTEPYTIICCRLPPLTLKSPHENLSHVDVLSPPLKKFSPSTHLSPSIWRLSLTRVSIEELLYEALSLLHQSL